MTGTIPEEKKKNYLKCACNHAILAWGGRGAYETENAKPEGVCMKTFIPTGASIMESAVELPSVPLAVSELSPLENFGGMIRLLRGKRSLEVHEIANRTGLPDSTIRAVEAGEAPLEEVLQALPALARGVGVRRQILAEALFYFGLAALEEEE